MGRRLWRMAVVHHGTPRSAALGSLRRALHRHGLMDGVHCTIDAVGADGHWARLPALLEQLLEGRPDVMVAIGAVAALAAQRATAGVPILHAVVLDPSDVGLTAPNTRGVTSFDPDQASRHVQLLGQLVPGLRALAVVTDASAPAGADGLNPLLSRMLQAASAQQIDVQCIALEGFRADLPSALGSLRRQHAQAMVALEVPSVLARLEEVARLAEDLRLPMLAPHGRPASGLVMQGAALHDAIDPLAEQVAALAGGASLSDMVLRRVHSDRLVIDRGRARRIGFTVPEAVIARATGYIDDQPGAAPAAAGLATDGGGPCRTA